MNILSARVLAIVASVVLVSQALAAATAGATTYRTLSNGLRCIVHRLPETSTVQVNLAYAIGSAEDPAGKAGLAHMVEHLMFISNKWYPDGSIRPTFDLHAIEWSAFTHVFHTEYLASCIPSQLHKILELEARRMQDLTPSPQELEREVKVLRNELGSHIRSGLDEELFVAMSNSAFNLTSEEGARIGGTYSSLDSITVADIAAFHELHMVPNNAVLAIVGPMPEVEVIGLVEGAFADIAESNRPVSHATYASHRNSTALEIEVEGYSGNVAGRIFRFRGNDAPSEVRKLVFETMVEAAGDWGQWYPARDETFFYIRDFGRSRKQSNRASGEELLDASWKEFLKAKRRIARKPQFDCLRREVTTKIHSRYACATVIASGLRNAGMRRERMPTREELLSELETLTIESTQDILEQILQEDSVLVGFAYGLSKEKRPEAPDTPALETAIHDPLEDLAATDIAVMLEAYLNSPRPTIERRRLKNKVPLYYFGTPGYGRFRLAGLTKYPYLKEERADQLPGLTLMLTYLMNSGYEVDDNTVITLHYPYWDPLPYGMRYYASPFSVSYSASGFSDEIDYVLDAIEKRLKSRSFSEYAWNGIRYGASQYFEGLHANKTIRSEAFLWLVAFGEDHPAVRQFYGKRITGKKFGRNDIHDLHKKLGKTGHTQYVVVSSAPLDDVVESLNEGLGKRGRYQGIRTSRPPPSMQGKHCKIINDRRADEVIMRLAFPIAPLALPDGLHWAETALFNKAMDQALSSALRIQTGLVYSSYMYPQPVGDHAFFRIFTAGLASSTIERYEVLMAELKSISSNGFTEDQWRRAQLALTADIYSWLNDPAKAFEFLLTLAGYGLVPSDPIELAIAVSHGRLNEVVAEVIDMENHAFSILGPVTKEMVAYFQCE